VLGLPAPKAKSCHPRKQSLITSRGALPGARPDPLRGPVPAPIGLGPTRLLQAPREGRIPHGHSDTELEELRESCRGRRSVYVLFNNTEMFSDARCFLRLLSLTPAS
jgi:uncharacterized protein YecE (DUF72 family)